MESVAGILRMITVLMALAGICVGAVQIIRSGFLFLTARGKPEQVREAKSILWHSVIGMVIIAGVWIFIP